MELTSSPRQAKSKSELKRLRREGNIPAILYSQGKEGEACFVNGAEFKKILHKIVPGTLPTIQFILLQGGKKRRAIIKEIQYHPTTYEVTHLDLEELFDNVAVNVNVPIQCTGAMDCVGVKLGGVFRQLIRFLKVNCLPKDIPAVLEIDVRNLDVNQEKRLRDLVLPHGVRPLAPLNEIAVMVAKK